MTATASTALLLKPGSVCQTIDFLCVMISMIVGCTDFFASRKWFVCFCNLVRCYFRMDLFLHDISTLMLRYWMFPSQQPHASNLFDIHLKTTSNPQVEQRPLPLVALDVLYVILVDGND